MKLKSIFLFLDFSRKNFKTFPLSNFPTLSSLRFDALKRVEKVENDFLSMKNFSKASPQLLNLGKPPRTQFFIGKRRKNKNYTRERIKSSSSDWFDSLLPWAAPSNFVVIVSTEYILLHDSLECCKKMLCNAPGGGDTNVRVKERERKILYISQWNLSLSFTVSSSLSPIMLLLIAFSFYSRSNVCCFFVLFYAVYACMLLCIHVTSWQREQSLSHLSVCVSFFWALRRWCCFPSRFCVCRNIKRNFYFGATFESVHERSLLIARKLIASICHILVLGSEQNLRNIFFYFCKLKKKEKK